MKKLNCCLLLFTVLLFSCQNDFDTEIQDSNPSIQLKETSTSNDFISQLEGVPVNITLAKGIVATDKMYLAAQRDGESNIAWLWVKDDDSGRQKFYIEKIYVIDGKQCYKIRALGGGYKGRNHVGDEPTRSYPVLWGDLPTGLGGWYFELNPQTNKYRIRGPKSGYRYLQAKQYNSKDLLVSLSVPNYGFGDWDIEPIGDLTIESISYYLTSDNKSVQKPDFIVYAEVSNGTDIQQSMTARFSTTATESSNFSQTEGYSASISFSFATGIPILAEGKINTSLTTSASWTYGKSQSISDTRSYDFPLIVPANSKYKAKAIVSMYDVNARYIAKCRLNNTNKTVYLEGNWNGVKAGDIKYEIYNDNVLVKSLSEKPLKALIIN